ncbi:hypothetical protein Tco_0046619 [Tanacetum coccineum]
MHSAYVLDMAVYFSSAKAVRAIQESFGYHKPILMVPRSELKEEALRNKAIMEGLINEDDESSNNGWRRWDGYEISDHDQEEKEYENEHEDEERCELFDNHELPICTIRRFEMIKYSFGQDEEYVAVK